ncbi:hypothetical protein [Fortiea contorta]|nr:hypothetical protein [Fortiea contorta]
MSAHKDKSLLWRIDWLNLMLTCKCSSLVHEFGRSPTVIAPLLAL